MANPVQARIIVGYGYSFAVMVADDQLKTAVEDYGLFNVFGAYVEVQQLLPGDYVLTYASPSDFRMGSIQHVKLEPTLVIVGLPNISDSDTFAEEWACLDDPSETIIRTEGTINKDGV